MPEEINRIVTDSISDYFFVTEPSGVANLKREGKTEDRVHSVGHVMVDSLLFQAAKLEKLDARRLETSVCKQRHPRYGVVTLHRPSNVDDPVALRRVMSALSRISEDLPLFFPVHPRTQDNLARFGVEVGEHIELMKPLAYMPFLNLWKDAVVVMTDSGGLQEETTALGVPCITIRDNTERPVTVDEGTNVLAGTDPDRLIALAREAIDGRGKRGRRPALWDGAAAQRIVSHLLKLTSAPAATKSRRLSSANGY